MTFCKSLSPTYVLLWIFALYLICISGIIHYVTKYHSKSLFNAHWNLFGQKVPWNFLQSSMELFEQHLNNTCGSMEFHGIHWNFVQIQSSMEFHGTFSILPSSMEFHGIPWNFFKVPFNFPPKSSMEFHGIPWNFFWSSMEFHGTWSEQFYGTLQFPWNSMELLVLAKLAYFRFHGIPWNSIDLLVSAKLAHS